MSADEMIFESPTSWPLYPLLPLVRYRADGGWPEIGFLVAGDGLIVYAGNVIDAPRRKGLPRETFADATGLLAAGWEIVYETGEWSAPKWKDAQALGPGETYVRIQWIEAFRRGKP